MPSISEIIETHRPDLKSYEELCMFFSVRGVSKEVVSWHVGLLLAIDNHDSSFLQ
jgi:hypothetical protein